MRLSTRNRMENTFLNHPAEELLERFVLDQSAEAELNVVETHILACDSCVARLETLEIQIAATKLALQELHKAKVARAVAKQQRTANGWFGLPKLSLIGVAAALVLGISIIPRTTVVHAPAAQVSLMAYRGSDVPVAPKNHELQFHLNANDLNETKVEVTLVDEGGNELWKGTAPVQQNEVNVTVPKIAQTGTHFMRLYAPQADGQSELLREFGFQVK